MDKRRVAIVMTLSGLLLLFGCHRAKPKNSETIQIVSKSQTKTLDSESYKKLFKKVTREDPSSGEIMSFWGYEFLEILPEDVAAVEMVATDGYKVSKNRAELEGAFIALAIEDVPEKGIYNRSLKTHFDWRPSYILFSKAHGSSPYQVQEITYLYSEVTNPIIEKAPLNVKPGALVYVKTCSKCHSHKGFGGHKAPPIAALLGRWPDTVKFKAFLKRPQQLKPGLKGMSPFEGSSQELDQLVDFLSTIEPL